MAKKDLGRTILDELRICYTAEPTLLDDLAEIDFGDWKNYGDFTLFRVVSKHFRYAYEVFYGLEFENRKKWPPFVLDTMLSNDNLLTYTFEWKMRCFITKNC